MREIFHGQLEQLGAELTVMCGLVGEAMTRASQGLLTADLHLVEQDITEHAEINRLAARIEDHANSLLALQAPVARDLRTVVTVIRAAEKIARMGDLAKHVAVTARRRHPRPAVPSSLAEQFAQMGRCGVAACNHLERSIAAPTGQDWAAPVRADDCVDRLNREILVTLAQTEPPFPVETAVDVTLLARFFERFSDQAVSVAKRLDYVVTGAMPDQPEG